MPDDIEIRSCLDCHNLRSKLENGILKVSCKFNKVKYKLYESVDQIGKNIIDSAIYKVSAKNCLEYYIDI